MIMFHLIQSSTWNAREKCFGSADGDPMGLPMVPVMSPAQSHKHTKTASMPFSPAQAFIHAATRRSAALFLTATAAGLI